ISLIYPSSLPPFTHIFRFYPQTFPLSPTPWPLAVISKRPDVHIDSPGGTLDLDLTSRRTG
ncbi:hypothetical protein BgiBS90_031810, partial [Biomphalaria glabrata]